jgi:hypothetical protein
LFAEGLGNVVEKYQGISMEDLKNLILEYFPDEDVQEIFMDENEMTFDQNKERTIFIFMNNADNENPDLYHFSCGIYDYGKDQFYYFDPMGSFSSDMFGNIYRKIHKFLEQTEEYTKFKLNTNNV